MVINNSMILIDNTHVPNVGSAWRASQRRKIKCLIQNSSSIKDEYKVDEEYICTHRDRPHRAQFLFRDSFCAIMSAYTG